MIISSCPRCQEPYLVPSGQVPDDAYAQCPWCRETFPMSEAMQRLPPSLGVFSSDGRPIVPLAHFAAVGAPANEQARGGYRDDFGFRATESPLAPWDGDEADDRGLAGTDRREFEADEPRSGRLVAAESEEVEPEFLIRDGSETPRPAAMRVQPMPSVGATPRRVSKRSPVKTLIGIALGPLLALPLAGAILLALGRAPDLGFWPFDGSYSGGGSASNAVMPLGTNGTAPPAGAPAADDAAPEGRSLAADLPPANDSAAVDPAVAAMEEITATSSDAAPAQPDEGEADPPAAEVPELELSPRQAIPAPSAPAMADVASADREANDREPLDLPEDQPAAPSVVEVDPASSPALESLSLPESSADPSATPSARDEAPPELIAARDEAGMLLDRLASFSGDEPERKQLLAKTYAALAKVGSLATADSEPALQEMLTQLSEAPALLDELANAAPIWMNYQKRTNDGVLVVGTITTTESSPAIELRSGLEIPVEGPEGAALPEGRTLGMGTLHETPSGRTIKLAIAQPLD